MGWSCPPDGMVKINVDVSFDVDSRSGAAGAVIRDEKGNCIAASNKFLSHVVDAEMAEATDPPS